MGVQDVVIMIAVYSLFAILFIGAALGWKPIIDPPKQYWLFYPQAFLRLFMSPPVLRVFTLLYAGIALIALYAM